MSRTRVLRLSAVAAGVIVLLFAAWAAWQAWQVNRDLVEAVDRAEAIRDAVEARDTDALQRELDALREASGSAADRTSGPTWSVLTVLPFFGDDAEGVRLTSEVLDDLAADGIDPLVTVSERVDELLPDDGAVDLAVVEELTGPVATAEEAFADADRRLAGQDTSGFVGRLDRQFSTFRDEVGRAADALGSARVATDLLPTLLGQDERRTYLLAFQNNAEVRGAGGLPGAVAYLRAQDGKVRIVRQVTGGSIGQTPKPVLPLTPGERKLYGDVLGTYFVDATMTPDVPRAAELMRAHSTRAHPDLRLDGVLLVDTVTMSYLLDATGPITVDGVEINGDNVVDELLHRTYLRLDAAEQDAFFAAVAGTAFDRFTDGAGSPESLLTALSRATGERRIAVHLFDEALQDRIAGTEIAGEATADPDDEQPRMAVTVNDTTGSKMSYFLRSEIDLMATSCVDGVQSFTAKARFRSVAPPDAAELPAFVTGGGVYGVDPGSQIVTVRMFGPAGGTLRGFRINGEPSPLERVELDGRPVGMTYLELRPGQTVDVSWKMKSGDGQVGAAVLTTTPTIEKMDSVTSVGSACR